MTLAGSLCECGRRPMPRHSIAARSHLCSRFAPLPQMNAPLRGPCPTERCLLRANWLTVRPWIGSQVLPATDSALLRIAADKLVELPPVRPTDRPLPAR